MNTKLLVETALRLWPELRNDDKLLTLQIWESQGLHLEPEQVEAFKRASSMDFISRRRRELMSQYPPSKDADARRHTHYTEELERHGKSKWFSKRVKGEK